MTPDLSEHEQYVAKLNSLVQSGRDELVEELSDDYGRQEPSGREAFWSRDRSEWIARELLRD